jgi:hypothetical protein
MLDLLLLRAQQASRKLYERATVLPNAYELGRLKRTEQFYNLMLEAIYAVADSDGRNVLSERRQDVIKFGELLAFVLWQLGQRQLTLSEYYQLLLDEQLYN